MSPKVNRRRGRLVAAALSSVMAFTGLAACGSDSDDSGSDDPIRVLLISGKSGPIANFASDADLGARAAIEMINANGGVDGRKIEYEFLDNGGDPTRSVSEFQKYLSSGKRPDLVIPGVSSAESLALAPILTREKIIGGNNAASIELNKPDEYPYYYSMAYHHADVFQTVGEDFSKLGAGKVVALLGNDAYGESNRAALAEQFEEAGIEFEAEIFNLADLDLTIAYERAVSKNPDVIYMDAVGEPAKRLFDAREAVDTSIPTVAGYGIGATDGGPGEWASAPALENVETAIVSSMSYVDPADRDESLDNFFTYVDEVGGLDDAVVFVPMMLWDIIHAYAQAVEDAGSTDPDKVKESLESLTSYEHLVTYESHQWSADDHFLRIGPDDVTLVGPSTVVDGMLKPIE